jgi:hypothetical protein
MIPDGFDLGDVVDLVTDLFSGDETPPDGGPPAAESPDIAPEEDLMQEQSERMPELQEVQQEQSAAALPSSEEQKEMLETQADKAEMAKTLSDLSQMKHSTAMGVIGNIR